MPYGLDHDYYLSGPMTGIPGHNFPAFHEAADRLRMMGHSVCNPAELGVMPGWEWHDYLRRDLPYVCRSRRVALMRGWQRSKGARLEVHVARELGMPIHDSDTLDPWGVPSDRWQGELVGLWGAARTGKDTLCEVLAMPRAAFADELKADFAVYVANHVTGDMTAEVKEIIRPALVAGGACARRLNPRAWIGRLFLPAGRACITDVRYLNECQYVWDKGGIVLEVVRPGIDHANDEERRSFTEIRQYLAQRPDVVVPTIFNDHHGDPSAMRGQANYYIQNHFNARAAA